MRVLICCVWGWCSGIGSFAQSGNTPTVKEFPLTGAGHRPFFRPVNAYVNPSLLGKNNDASLLELSYDQFTDLPETRRFELTGLVPVKSGSAFSAKLLLSGKEHYQIYKAGIGYGSILNQSADSAKGWSMGARFECQAERFFQHKNQFTYLAGIGVGFWRENLIAGTHIYIQSTRFPNRTQTGRLFNKWLWMASTSINIKWTKQLSSDILFLYEPLNPVHMQVGIQYYFYRWAYLRFQLAHQPALLAWEQGYQLKKYWLTMHMVRYPMIGWKAGFGLIINFHSENSNYAK